MEATLRSSVENPVESNEFIVCPNVICCNVAMGLSNPIIDCSDEAIAQFQVPGAKDRSWYFVATFKVGKMSNSIRITHPQGNRLSMAHYYWGK